MDITGRKLFVKALQEEGVDTIFGYPGGMVTDLFDELYKQDAIEVVLPRHEQGLLHEAEGYAKATGKVGVCLVTSGPGATNIITGLADAHYDNIPLVCFTGQVPLNLIGNDAFQEVDIVGMTRSVTRPHYQNGISHCNDRQSGTGTDRYPKRYTGGIRSGSLSGQSRDPRI